MPRVTESYGKSITMLSVSLDPFGGLALSGPTTLLSNLVPNMDAYVFWQSYKRTYHTVCITRRTSVTDGLQLQHAGLILYCSTV